MVKEAISEFSEFNGTVFSVSSADQLYKIKDTAPQANPVLKAIGAAQGAAAQGAAAAGTKMQDDYAAYMRKKDADAAAAKAVATAKTSSGGLTSSTNDAYAAAMRKKDADAKTAAASPYAFMANVGKQPTTPTTTPVQGNAATSASAGQKMQSDYAAYMLKKDADAKAAASPYAFMATMPGIKGSSVPSTPSPSTEPFHDTTAIIPNWPPKAQPVETGVTVNGQAAPPEVQQMFEPLPVETGVTTNGMLAQPEVQQLFQPSPVPIVQTVTPAPVKHGWLHRLLAKLGLIDE